MHIDAVLNMLKANGVSNEDIKQFKEKLKDKNFTETKCDKLLIKLGYEPIFSFDEDDDDYEYEYDSYEKNQHKINLEN